MLPYTANVLFSNFAQYNAALWPLPVAAVLLALAALVLAFRPVRHGDRIVSSLLVLAWLWTGYGYHYLQFAQINFAAPIYAGFFLLQGLLLAWTGLARGHLAFGFRSDAFRWLGLLLALAAALAVPLADGLLGYGWESVRIVGLAPTPTAVFTLGLLLMSGPPPARHLAIIPLLWSLVAGASDQYRFEVLRPDGSKLVVHHYAERAEIGAEELEWHRRNYVSIYR
ncbi:MAG: DUF6064 family protein, partial [Geminicoccaceae bacterium]|nr:DUF6064 family protein [Geminicoccaceae bacterium]